MKFFKIKIKSYLYLIFTFFTISYVVVNYRISFYLHEVNENFVLYLFGLTLSHYTQTENSVEFSYNRTNVFISSLIISLIVTFIIYLFVTIKKGLKIMPVQKCKICSEKFIWVEIIKSIWRGYRPIRCNKCHTEYKFTFFSRLLWSLICMGPLPFMVLLFRTPFWESITKNWTFTAEYFSHFIPFVLWIIITQTFLPFLVRYKAIN